MKKTVLVIVLFSLVTGFLFYSRFVNLGWGLPYPFHPDERNMAVAITQLQCPYSVFSVAQHVKNCMNPHFYAYGQLPLYLGFTGIILLHKVFGIAQLPIMYSEAVLALRSISAVSAILVVGLLLIVLWEVESDIRKHPFFMVCVYAVIVAMPVFIQSAHFGTTESLLQLFEMLILWMCIRFMHTHRVSWRFFITIGFLFGLALGVKISSVLMILPIGISFVFFRKHIFNSRLKAIRCLIPCGVGSGIGFFLASPQYFFSFHDALISLRYESAVAQGSIVVFYTRQFINAIPIFFSFIHILPYTVGLPILFFCIIGFIILPRTTSAALIRITTGILIVSTALFFTQWTRFQVFVYPFLMVCALWGIYRMIDLSYHFSRFGIVMRVLIGCAMIVSIVWGTSYLSIYTHQDVRLVASEWIYQHIPSGSYILSEAGNVVDMPIMMPGKNIFDKAYHIQNIDLYEAETDPIIQEDIDTGLQNADYVIIPSRRVFANESCTPYFTVTAGYTAGRCARIAHEFPVAQSYYSRIFAQKEFRLRAVFTSYPQVTVFGRTIISFPDEQAEETWSVFDHPVIRIYQRTP